MTHRRTREITKKLFYLIVWFFLLSSWVFLSNRYPQTVLHQSISFKKVHWKWVNMFLLMCGHFMQPNEVSTPVEFRMNVSVSHQHWWRKRPNLTHKQRQHCRGGERSGGRMSSCLYVVWTSAIKSTTSWQKPVSRITFEKAAASLSSPPCQQKLPLIFFFFQCHFFTFPAPPGKILPIYEQALCLWPLNFPSVDDNLGVLAFSGYCAGSLWLRFDVVSISL